MTAGCAAGARAGGRFSSSWTKGRSGRCRRSLTNTPSGSAAGSASTITSRSPSTTTAYRTSCSARRRARATEPRTVSRSRYALDPAVIAAGKLPDKAPVVTSAANPHYQKRFDELHKLAAAGDWAAVHDYKISGSNSYSKLIARYQQDLLALHAAWQASQ